METGRKGGREGSKQAMRERETSKGERGREKKEGRREAKKVGEWRKWEGGRESRKEGRGRCVCVCVVTNDQYWW